MPEYSPFNRMKLVSSLMKIPHGKLSNFVNDALPAAKTDPELFAHLVAWNHKGGKVRDSKVAFPIIALRGLAREDRIFAENAVAHVASLDPRDCLRAYLFSKELTKSGNRIPGGHRRTLETAIKRYLEVREANVKWWDRFVLSSRKAVLGLYAVSHKKPSPRAQAILFEGKYPNGSVFERVANLKNMSALEAAGTILKYKIPFQVAVGSVNKAKDPDIVMALIEGMSGNELINSTAMLKKLGVFEVSSLKAAYDAAIERAKKDTRVNIFKASRAAEVLDEKTAKKVVSVQRSQERSTGGIMGNWLVLGDKSSSMSHSIEITKQVAAALASQVNGKVYLIFFNETPQPYEITGMSFDQVAAMTKQVRAYGNTSIGSGLAYATDKGLEINGIAIVSDGGENAHPSFVDAYRGYVRKFNLEPSIHLLHVDGDINRLHMNCKVAGVPLEEYELGHEIDIYSLPNIVRGMKAGRYALLEEIMEAKLLTLNEVFDGKKRRIYAD